MSQVKHHQELLTRSCAIHFPGTLTVWKFKGRCEAKQHYSPPPCRTPGEQLGEARSAVSH